MEVHTEQTQDVVDFGLCEPPALNFPSISDGEKIKTSFREAVDFKSAWRVDINISCDNNPADFYTQICCFFVLCLFILC